MQSKLLNCAAPKEDLSRLSRARRGYTLLELVIACALLGAVTTIALNTFHWISLERRACEQEQEALAEVANIMERVISRPWDALTTESVKDVVLSDHVLRQLPGAALAILVTEDSAAPSAKRISIDLTWRNRAGQLTAPIRLAAFTYRQSGSL